MCALDCLTLVRLPYAVKCIFVGLMSDLHVCLSVCLLLLLFSCCTLCTLSIILNNNRSQLVVTSIGL